MFPVQEDRWCQQNEDPWCQQKKDPWRQQKAQEYIICNEQMVKPCIIQHIYILYPSGSMNKYVRMYNGY